jgi:hypothetical protein
LCPFSYTPCLLTPFWKAERKIITIYEAVRDSVPWDVICVRTKHTVSIYCGWFGVFAKDSIYTNSQRNTHTAAFKSCFDSTVLQRRSSQVLTSMHHAAPMMAIVSGPTRGPSYL